MIVLLKYHEVPIGQLHLILFIISPFFFFSIGQAKVPIGHYITKQPICSRMVVIFVDKNVSNVIIIVILLLLAYRCSILHLGNKRLQHGRDSNNNTRRNASNLDKSTTSTGSAQRSPLSSASDKSCDEQILLMQHQQQAPPALPRSMYMHQPGLESPDSRNVPSGGKQLKQEQCEYNPMPSFDSHTFPNYSPFTINTLIMQQGFGDNPAALNAYYASQLPQTAFVPSTSADYYPSSMYPSQANTNNTNNPSL